MERISFKRQHSLGYAEACAKLSAVAEQLKSRYQLEVTSKTGQVDLSGKGLRGQLVVAQYGTIDVDIELIGPVMMIKGRVEDGINKALWEQFN